MIEVEPTLRDRVGTREIMQFIERRVADQVTPEGVMGRPAWRVDEDSHGRILGRRDTASAAFVGLGGMK